ncbi:hypothetical protein C8R46DRAFT_259485 [Mycena filopes]|nr:hypothetical protein C8R46DRAFT_259485 [Mycena filopes]
MESPNSLTYPCNESIRCVSQIAPGSILSTYPELLSSTAGPPSDSQAALLRSELERAKHESLTANPHIAHLQNALVLLLRHRDEMDDIIRTHTGMLSTLRRFPNEILLEVFQQTLVESAAVDLAPWVLSQVCSHWRRVTLMAPSLWRHFPRSSFDGNRLGTPMMSLQLERAQHASLSINFGNSVSPYALGLLLPLASQWQDVVIPETSFMSPQLTGPIFSTLNKLTLTSPPYMSSHPSSSDIDRVGSLPCLTHLRLEKVGQPSPFSRHLLLPWFQLHICDLHGLSWPDVSWILPQLNHGTLVTILRSALLGVLSPPTKQTTSLARSLTLTNCDPRFLRDILSNLFTPALDTLILQAGRLELRTNGIVEAILLFLNRSVCPLEHLCLNARLNEDELAQILESPHIHNATDLDFPRARLSPRSIAALATLPNLRTLAVCGTLADEAALLAALTTQHPRVISHPSEPSQRLGAAEAGELRLRFTFA